MNNSPLSLLLMFPVAAAALAIWLVRYRRAESIFNAWAARNGYQIIEREKRRLMRGPFFLTTGKSQVVFRVLVQDRSGQLHHGYVRCGGRFSGLFSDQTDVRWDPTSPHQPGFPVVFPAKRDS